MASVSDGDSDAMECGDNATFTQMKCYEEGYDGGRYILDAQEDSMRSDLWEEIRNNIAKDDGATMVFASIFNSRWKRNAAKEAGARKCPPAHQALRIIASVLCTGFATIGASSPPLVRLGDAKEVDLWQFATFCQSLMTRVQEDMEGSGKGKQSEGDDTTHTRRVREVHSMIQETLAQYDASEDLAVVGTSSCKYTKLSSDVQKYCKEFAHSVPNIALYGEAMEVSRSERQCEKLAVSQLHAFFLMQVAVDTPATSTLETRPLRQVQAMFQAPQLVLPDFDTPANMLVHGADNRDPSRGKYLGQVLAFGQGFCKTFLSNHGVGKANAIVVHAVRHDEDEAAIVAGRYVT